jgi:hypothetical protein
MPCGAACLRRVYPPKKKEIPLPEGGAGEGSKSMVSES